MQSPIAANNSYRVFVGNMSSRVSESDLRAMMEPFGTVQNVYVVKVKATGESRGFAFVDMTDQRAVARAIAELNGKDVDGCCLKVRLGF